MRFAETDHVICFNESHGLFVTRLCDVVLPYGKKIFLLLAPVLLLCIGLWKKMYTSWNSGNLLEFHLDILVATLHSVNVYANHAIR